MGVAIALGVAALGTGIASGVSQAGAAADANRTNAQNAAADRALQLQLFRESRGAAGSSLLPLYAPGGSEADLLNRALQTYYAETGDPNATLQNYQSIVSGALPTMTAGDQLISDLFGGRLAEQQVANMQPVFQARAAVAGAQKQGILEALSQRLSALKAERQRAGYSGGGSAYEKNLLTQASIPALQQAASVGAQADLASATDTANIRNQDIATRLANINLPLARAANKIQLNQLPATALSQQLMNAQSGLNWFRLGPQTITPFQTPMVSPVPSTGAIVGSAVGNAASTLGNYYLTRNLLQQINPSGQPVQTAANTTYVQPSAVTDESLAGGVGGYP